MYIIYKNPIRNGFWVILFNFLKRIFPNFYRILYQATGRITAADIERITPYEEGVLPYVVATQQMETIAAPSEKRTFLSYIAEQAYRFGLGVVAGIAGTLVVYPIDSVKTRLQNQKTVGSISAADGMMYMGYMDCFHKVRRYEGIRALYNGLGAQVMFYRGCFL